jgi:2-C-methyl-D-erythritol 4-phosphate cytidylyltransferase
VTRQSGPGAPSTAHPDVWAVVVAAGAGTRLGADLPKQYLQLGTTRVLDHSLAATRTWCADRIALVVPPERAAIPEPGVRVVAGGATRSASVRAGLAAVPADARIVLVHDAARPLVPAEVFARVIAAVRDGADAAIPAMAVVDTIKRVRDGVVVETLDRAELVAVQTPQAFRADVLRRVHATLEDASDDAALVEQAGGRVVIVDGHELARKLTTADDLAWLASHLETQ